jgi:alpha-glucoside transport system permease protein
MTTNSERTRRRHRGDRAGPGAPARGRTRHARALVRALVGVVAPWVRGANRARLGASPALACVFILPALLLLGALVVYPIVYTVGRSLLDAPGSTFVGLANYAEMFTDSETFTALRNNAIWVVVAPAVVTSLGLMFAVLTERIRWGTAFKLLVFMPMAISMLAAGIIFRLVYEQEPDRGVLNAVVVGVHDTVVDASTYPGARVRGGPSLTATPDGGVQTTGAHGPGKAAAVPVVGVQPADIPTNAGAAARPEAAGGAGVHGVVWFDFTPGGGGRPGRVDPKERGLPGVRVQAVKDGKVAGTATTLADGSFAFPELTGGGYVLRLPGSNFAPPFNGVTWLGPTLVTPMIIGSYIWMWAGFAMVLIAAGLAAIPRDALEAARVDGATEWQTFRRVTVPLLAPVLVVVLVTLIINVLKIFDLVYIIAPGPVQEEANVLALQMYLKSFGGGNNQGLGSAIAVFLFLLVLPAMIFNIRRFRREQR